MAIAYTAIARITATSFVDLMRLLYLTTTGRDDFERKRLPEFLATANNHLRDLRSYIEGFAPILDEDAHTRARRLEGRLRWLCQSLNRDEKVERLYHENGEVLKYFKESHVLSGEVFDFLSRLSVEKFGAEWEMIKEVCAPKLRGRTLTVTDLHGRKLFMQVRFACQSALPTARGILDVAGPFIHYDVDGTLDCAIT